MLNKAMRMTYLLWDENQDLKALWSKFALANPLTPAVEQSGMFGSTDEGKEHYLFFHKNTVVLIETFLSDKLATMSASEVVTMLKDQPYLPEQQDKYGETWVLVSDSQELYSEFTPVLTPAGSLVYQPNGDWHKPHIYYFVPDNSEIPSEEHFLQLLNTLLLVELPIFEAALFQMLRKVKYFRDQQKAIINERSTIDAKLGHILHRQLRPSKEELVDSQALIDTIQELSRMYGTLAGHTAIAVNNIDHLREGQRNLNKLLKRVAPQTAHGSFYQDVYLSELESYIEEIKAVRDRLSLSMANAKASIDVVQTQVELIRSAEGAELQSQIKGLMEQNLHLSKEGIALQVAAAFIEFIVVIYYGLSIWKTLAPTEAFHHVSSLWKLIILVGFAGSAVVCTHQAAEVLQKNRKARLGLGLATACLLGLFGAMVWLSLV